MLLSCGIRWTMLLMATVSSPLQATEPTVTVHEPWVAEGPPGARVVAGYLELRNTSETTRYLVGVSSTQADRVEMHQTVLRDGVARMVHQERLEIPAGGRTSLEPGGLHLMLIRPQNPRVGDQIPMTLKLDDGTKIDLSAEVRKRSAQSHHHHHH